MSNACPQRCIRFADAILEWGLLSQVPKPAKLLNAGEFRPLRRATRALPSTCQLLKKLDQNFNTGARRMRLLELGRVFLFRMRGACAGRSYATEAAISGVYRESWESHAAALRREMDAGTARPRPP